MHVLITGAGGHLGRKLFDTLESDPGYIVSGIDIRGSVWWAAADDHGTRVAELL